MYAAAESAAPRLVDLSTPLTEDTQLTLLTERDPEALKVVRHSAAHVMATAVLELFPETKLGHGPATPPQGSPAPRAPMIPTPSRSS
jgi:threonyl-tRNA synthetase